MLVAHEGKGRKEGSEGAVLSMKWAFWRPSNHNARGAGLTAQFCAQSLAIAVCWRFLYLYFAKHQLRDSERELGCQEHCSVPIANSNIFNGDLDPSLLVAAAQCKQL